MFPHVLSSQISDCSGCHVQWQSALYNIHWQPVLYTGSLPCTLGACLVHWQPALYTCTHCLVKWSLSFGAPTAGLNIHTQCFIAFTLNTAQCTLSTAHCTLHPIHRTMLTAQCTLYIAHCASEIRHNNVWLFVLCPASCVMLRGPP